MTTCSELLSENGIPIRESGHRHCRVGWVQFNCPFCDHGYDSFHMGYNLAYGYANCWKCGKHSLYSILKLILYKYSSGKGLAKLISELPKKKALDTPKNYKLSIPKGLTDLKRPFKQYLKGRGFAIKTICRLWDIECFNNFSKHKGRLFIPIHHHNQVVSWTTRTIEKKSSMRYISASEEEEAIPHKSLLYGEDYARHAIIIVEGPMDVWKIGPGAVATFGTNFTYPQMLKMSKYPRRFICYDSEHTAQKEAMRLTKLLSVFPGITANIKLESDDPGEADHEEIQELREFAFS